MPSFFVPPSVKIFTGPPSTWTADFPGQTLMSSDLASYSIPRTTAAGAALGGIYFQQSPAIFQDIALDGAFNIAQGSGELLLSRFNTNLNVIAIGNSDSTQGACSAIAWRNSNNIECGATGYANRGTGTILYPFVDTVYVEGSNIASGGTNTVAKDIFFHQAHLDGSGAIVYNQRMRIVEQGATLFYKNNMTAGFTAWTTQTFNLSIDDTRTIIANKLRLTGLPTSSSGLSSGDVYSNAGILTIVP
jgi:hypothetical protein